MCLAAFELRKAFGQKARIGVYTNGVLVKCVMNELEQIASTVGGGDK